MFIHRKISLGIALSVSGLVVNPVSAYDFGFSAGETSIYQTDFSVNDNWTLSGTSIDTVTGVIKGSAAFGRATYPLPAPVNLDLGDVFLYWSGIFPVRPTLTTANQEVDRYFVGLQYANNPPVCRQGTQIVSLTPCTGTQTEFDEEAELKVEMRPKNPTNPGNTLHRIYLDPDADPVNNLYTTQVTVPNYTEGVAMDFRLGFRKVSSTDYQVNWFYRNDSASPWQTMTNKLDGSPLILNLKNTDWVDTYRWFVPAPAPFESPVTFEAIRLQFRKGSTRDSAITALALTQIRTSPPIATDPLPVPEKASSIALLSLVGLGALFTRRQQKKENSRGF
ncbi:hypothetical protein V0288_10710 [Pannus brasiliensis CCIBt3594]|uniref:PEP-CTERM sorting domain-containing protein n=1 Tax=Pannus brasiliensis CCIBt3594 TaxID=1427578 RepID=A0AAW9QX27_9CHRO